MQETEGQSASQNEQASAVSAVGLTDPGKTREHNEDNFFIDNTAQLYIVSDGVGGHQAGEKASEAVVSVLPMQINEALQGVDVDDEDEILAAVDQSIRLLNQDLREFAGEAAELRGMGATVVTCLVRGSKAFISHMGDSRAYLARGNKLECLTDDHSIVGLMLRMGEIDQHQAKMHPMRHVITRHVGMNGDFGPDSLIVDLEEGDILLMCSDGLTEMVPDNDINTILRSGNDLKLLCSRLVDTANMAGGKDNITVVLIQKGKRDTDNSANTGEIKIRRVNSYLEELGL